MSEQAEQLKQRTMRFALDVCALMPVHEPGPTVKRQLAKAANAVAFNYRVTCRARSHAEFTAKMAVVAEESSELTAMFSASVGTARYKERNK